ncbi:hypothetical protein LGH70_08190 [Hymenobacter sp. BT635]|uniref:Uncharacterized protein n=1 Tax=Hymenobacter nitidus TaxID=2880929 RepID=A0ABS8AAY9_9BACT|nr:hypothetical protein [Hymenobacter nitidus]MCB2377558.1 hypothetical protein [Hymenobacter nitidus]
MRKRLNINLLPLLLLVVVSFYTVYTALFGTVYLAGEERNISLDPHHYTGFAALAVALVLYGVRSKYFKYGVLLLLLLWMVGIANYLPVSLGVGVGFGELKISLQLIALVFMAVYYALNRNRAEKKLSGFLASIAVKPDSEKAERHRREDKEKFRQTFKLYSTEKLQTIVQERKLVGLALEAAQELLSERIK